MTAIKKAAVIGAGVMGAGIAAHIANAGVPVVLLDIVPKGAENRNALAEGAVQKMLKTKPKSFMHPSRAKLVTTGNLEDDLGQLADVDWIVEAVIENLDIKRRLYATLDEVRKPGSIVSSNTSTIPLGLLVDGRSAAFKSDFLITHFFNPPRYMRLLELVAGPETRPDAVETIRAFGDHALGKGVVDCKDTVSNRCIAEVIGVVQQDPQGRVRAVRVTYRDWSSKFDENVAVLHRAAAEGRADIINEVAARMSVGAGGAPSQVARRLSACDAQGRSALHVAALRLTVLYIKNGKFEKCGASHAACCALLR